VLAAVTATLAEQGLVGADRLPDVQVSIAVMDADQLARARRAYRLVDALGFWLPVAWALLVLLTLLLSHRRLAATSKLALASLFAVGLLALFLAFAREEVTSDLQERDVALAVWDVVVAGLWRAIEVSLAGLVVVAVAAGALGLDRTPAPAYDED
jgi:hypothetical protein